MKKEKIQEMLKSTLDKIADSVVKSMDVESEEEPKENKW